MIAIMSHDGSNDRLLFHRYIYDYLVTYSMHQSAEILKREADLPAEALIPPGMSDGLMHNWWIAYNEMVNSHQAGSSDMVEHMSSALHMTQQTYLSEQHLCNERMIRERLTAGNDCGLTKGVSLELSLRSPLINSQDLTSGRLEQKSSTVTKLMVSSPGSHGDIVAQVVGYSDPAKAKIMSNVGGDSVFPGLDKTFTNFSSLAEQFPNEIKGKQHIVEPINLMNLLGSEKKSQDKSTSEN